MRSRSLRGPRVLIDDPHFLLAGDKAKTDPGAELEADLRAFAASAEQTIEGRSKHPQCRFAARFDFLKERLRIDPARFAVRDCPDVRRFQSFASYTRAFLVFSNYFVDNPASMFGHTLLRLHRDEASVSSGLLDDAANFAAQTPKINPLTYPFQGLLGFFRGRFALLTYSEKIQEYNNFESRDLWEYELELSPHELRRLSLMLWEVGDFSTSYYYLDENCSFILLALLEAAKPELRMTDSFHLYAIPSDTVKAAASQPGFIRAITYKPSARSRYLARAKVLQREEKAAFLEIAQMEDARFAAGDVERALERRSCAGACAARVLDAVAEFIDFKEKKVSTREAGTRTGLRKAALMARARLRQPSEPLLAARPEETRPDRGPRSGMVEAASGVTTAGFNVSELRWRPAHHDLGSSSTGYSDQLQIQVLDSIVARDAEFDRVFLKRLAPLELLSLGRQELAISPLSWKMGLDYRSLRARRRDESREGRYSLDAGLGLARFFGPFSIYAMAGARGGYSDDSGFGWHVGAGPRFGAYLSFGERVRLSASFAWTSFVGEGGETDERREIESRLSFAWRAETELSLWGRDEDRRVGFGLGTRFYF